MFKLSPNANKVVQGGILMTVLVLAIFFPYFQDYGIKWQTALLPMMSVLFFRNQKFCLTQLDVLLVGLAAFVLSLAIFSNIAIHINLAIGLLVSLLISKIEIDETTVVLLAGGVLLTHHIVFDVLPLTDYVQEFNNLNELYGVNRSAFIFFVFYFFLYLKGAEKRYIFALVNLLHSSRLMILSIILIEIMTKKLFVRNLVILTTSTLFVVLFVDRWLVNYYFINLADASTADRIERYRASLIGIMNNFLLPKFSYEGAPHNFIIELINYSGFVGVIGLIIIFYTRNKKVLVLFISLALMSPKTLHDLLIFYIFFGWMLKYMTKDVKTISIRL